MGDENARPDLVEQCRNGLRIHLRVVGAGVRDHLPEELVERIRVARELDARIQVWPGAEPEDAEPELLVGRSRYGDRLCAACGASAPRLVDQVDREVTAQKDVLEPLAPVWRGLPCLG